MYLYIHLPTIYLLQVNRGQIANILALAKRWGDQAVAGNTHVNRFWVIYRAVNLIACFWTVGGTWGAM